MITKEQSESDLFKQLQPQTDFIKNEHIEREEAEARMREMAETNQAKINTLHHTSESNPSKQYINPLRAIVIEQLRKDFSFEATVSQYFEKILVTVSRDNFEQQAELIAKDVQNIVNAIFYNRNDSLTVIIHGYDKSKNKVINFFKTK